MKSVKQKMKDDPMSVRNNNNNRKRLSRQRQQKEDPKKLKEGENKKQQKVRIVDTDKKDYQDSDTELCTMPYSHACAARETYLNVM